MTLPDGSTQIGQYEIESQLGSGGMATVYLAYQPKLDRRVAVKMMHQTFTSDSNFLTRFQREARIVARLDHPNIVPIYDYDEHNNVPYLVMKYVEGRTLKRMLNEAPLSLADIRHLLPPIADALTYAHSQGILHRDVKPSNVIIADDGTPFLTDFGLARVASAGESTLSADMMLGTPNYISPEQAQGGTELTPRTDVYSLGIVLYELVVGAVPFTGDTPYITVHKHIFSQPRRPSEANPELSSAIDAVLLRALAKDPAERHQTPNDLMRAFERALDESGVVHLDDAHRAQLRSSVQQPSSPPPIHRVERDELVEYVNIPSPMSADADAYDVPGWSQVRNRYGTVEYAPGQYPSLLSMAFLQIVIDRFREALLDLRDQIASPDFWQRARHNTERNIEVLPAPIRTPIQSVTDQVRANTTRTSGTSVKLGPVQVGIVRDDDTITDERVVSTTPQAMPVTKPRRRASIQRDWNVDEGTIRRRLTNDRRQWQGFGVHLLIYTIGGAVLLANTDVASQIMTDIASEPGNEFLMPLSTINIPLLFMLFWTGGLLGHLLNTFARTGRRRRARREAIDRAMRSRFGENWTVIADDRDYRRVRRSINRNYDRRISFFRQLIGTIFFLLGFGLAWPAIQQVIIAIPNMDQGFIDFFTTAPILPIVFFLALVGVTINGIGVLLSPVMGGEAQERAVEREITRERERMGISPPYNPASKPKRDYRDEPDQVRLTGDGELTDSYAQQWHDDPANHDLQR